MPDFDRDNVIDDLLRLNFTRVRLPEAREVMNEIRECMLNVLCDDAEDEAELRATHLLHGSCPLMIMMETACVHDELALLRIEQLRDVLLRATALTYKPEFRAEIYQLYSVSMR